MKKLLFVLLVSTFSLLAFAKGEKVLESSSRQTPGWVYGMETGFIITTAEAGTMDNARALAMQQVKERVLSSVAEHVESESSMSSSEMVTESDIQSLSVFAKQIKTKAADIPFLNDISEAHVADYYWEKVRKPNDQIVYIYNIKYPFSDLQIRHIIKEWKDAQALSKLEAKELEDKLAEYSRLRFSSLPTVENMLEKVNEVQMLQKSLPEKDEKHIKACAAVIDGYKRQLGEIQIRQKNITREFCDYELMCGASVVTYQGKPKLKSNCLTEIQFEPTESGERIVYNYQAGCYEDEPNFIEITYTIFNKKITNKFFVK